VPGGNQLIAHLDPLNLSAFDLGAVPGRPHTALDALLAKPQLEWQRPVETPIITVAMVCPSHRHPVALYRARKSESQ
jgi:hypothetical protein